MLDKTQLVAIKSDYFQALLELEKAVRNMVAKTQRAGADASDHSQVQNRFLWKVEQCLEQLKG